MFKNKNLIFLSILILIILSFSIFISTTIYNQNKIITNNINNQLTQIQDTAKSIEDMSCNISEMTTKIQNVLILAKNLPENMEVEVVIKIKRKDEVIEK